MKMNFRELKMNKILLLAGMLSVTFSAQILAEGAPVVSTPPESTETSASEQAAAQGKKVEAAADETAAKVDAETQEYTPSAEPEATGEAVKLQEIPDFKDFEEVGLEKETIAILDSDQDGVMMDVDECRGTPFNVPVDERGCVVCPEDTLKDELGCYTLVIETKVYPVHVKFDSNSSKIRGDYKAEIYQLTEFFMKSKAEKVVIEGHTDNIGGDDFNLKLSQSRADAVVAAMVGYGMSAIRLEAKGFGEMVPVGDNGTAEGRLQNRRVNAVVELVEEKKVYSVRH